MWCTPTLCARQYCSVNSFASYFLLSFLFSIRDVIFKFSVCLGHAYRPQPDPVSRQKVCSGFKILSSGKRNQKKLNVKQNIVISYHFRYQGCTVADLAPPAAGCPLISVQHCSLCLAYQPYCARLLVTTFASYWVIFSPKLLHINFIWICLYLMQSNFALRGRDGPLHPLPWLHHWLNIWN